MITIAAALLTAAFIPQAAHITLDGTPFGSPFGEEVACVGDVDGDGQTDWLIGVPTSAGGALIVYSGRTGAIVQTLSASQLAFPVGRLGFDADGVGDVDGDGLGDFVVGAPWSSARDGRALIVAGSTNALLLNLPGPATHETEFGTSVAGLGDIDGDGTPDVAVGAPTGLVGTTVGLSVRAVSGLDGSTLWFRRESSQQIGASLDAIGDLDGDGIRDLLVGARQGPVRVRSGANGAVIRTFPGAAAANTFGSDSIGTGDLDSDGIDDIAVGEPLATPAGPASGRVRVYSGATASLLFTFDGLRGAERAGTALTRAGDVNGDGTPDLAVGAPGYGAPFPGRVYLVSGADGTLLHTIESSSGGELGRSLAGPLRFNRDLYPDILVGQPSPFSAPRALVLSTMPFEDYCTATQNSTGGAARLQARGSARISRNDLRLEASSVPAGWAQLAIGTTPAALPLGSGVLCLGGTIQRLAPGLTVGGSLITSIDVPTVGPAPGTTLFFQAIFRDATPTAPTFNFTRGLAITFEL